MSGRSENSTEAERVVSVYLTFPDEETAVRIGREVVHRRLAACVNIVGEGTSIYRWEGDTKEGREFFAVAKTTSGRAPALVEAVRDLHPFTVPAAVTYEATGGLDSYLEWVRAEVRGE